MSTPPLLTVANLKTWFPKRTGLFASANQWVKAVDGVSFSIHPGESLGLVGESGSGKTTVGRSILRLIPATDGHVVFDGESVLTASGKRLAELRRQMSIIFQDPAGSLDPRMRVESIVAEPIDVHGYGKNKKKRRLLVETLLERCGMSPSDADKYPHEFSGGQRQRIGIARALALRPKFIVCDEPTSALDVSVQAQVINLLRDLQDDLKLSYLFISHDMAVVQHMCQRIAVMKDGVIVETGSREQIVNDPQHEYTKQLLSAVPVARVG
ncbi:MAG: ABC-type oligopeptide transport system ATPase subunit [Phycisphaerales bacterium]|jgi:ABC-type oligopeptide transport system ATPase subunit